MEKIVTTYLEMFERPSFSTIERPESTVLLRAEEPTVSFYRFLYDSVGRNWKWVDRKKLNDEELQIIIRDQRVEIHVLYVKGVPAGYAELDFRRSEEVEIAYFGLMPEFIGRGMGRFLLLWAIHTAWDRKPKRLWVHTCTLDHPGALPLYQKCGFKIYKTEEH
jgi:GNAT superfamily N-acetyltransferase